MPHHHLLSHKSLKTLQRSNYSHAESQSSSSTGHNHRESLPRILNILQTYHPDSQLANLKGTSVTQLETISASMKANLSSS